MADPTNPNDPTYKNNPNYVFSGGRWQYVSNPTTAKGGTPPGGNTNTTGVSIGTPGINLDPSMGAGAYLDAAGATKYAQMPTGDFWNNLFKQAANAPLRENPYSMNIAQQTRAPQLALLKQMRQTAAGPSLVALQGQRAMGQNAMGALGAMGRGPLGSMNALGQQARAGAGMAEDIANARAQETLGQSRGQFGLASGIRAGDLAAAQAQAQGALGMRGLDVGQRLWGAGQGANLDISRQRNAIEMLKLYQRLQRQIQQDNQAGQQMLINGAASGLSMVAGI